MDLINKILTESEENNFFKPRRIEKRTTPSLQKGLEYYKELIKAKKKYGWCFITSAMIQKQDENNPYALDDYLINCLLEIPEIKKGIKNNLNFVKENAHIANKVSLILQNLLLYNEDTKFKQKYNL